MKKRSLKSLESLARKNRESSQAAHLAETGVEPSDKKRKQRGFEEKAAPDPRYEGAEKLFKEMKRRDRP